MVKRVLYYHCFVVFLLIIAFTGINCARKTEPPVKYQYAVIKGRYSCSFIETKNSAFDKRIYKKSYEEVRRAAAQVLSQRGAILEINQSNRTTVIVMGYGQLGTFYNSLIAIGIARYRNRITEVAVAWVDPQNAQCTEIELDEDELFEEYFDSFTPSEQRQALAFMVGSEFIMQLSTQLYGTLMWHKKFW